MAFICIDCNFHFGAYKNCPKCGGTEVEECDVDEYESFVEHIQSAREAMPPTPSPEDLADAQKWAEDAISLTKLKSLIASIEEDRDQLEQRRSDAINLNNGLEPDDKEFDLAVARLELLQHFLDRVPEVLARLVAIANATVAWLIASEACGWFEDSLSIIPNPWREEETEKAEELRKLQVRNESQSSAFVNHFEELFGGPWNKKLGNFDPE